MSAEPSYSAFAVALSRWTFRIGGGAAALAGAAVLWSEGSIIPGLGLLALGVWWLVLSFSRDKNSVADAARNDLEAGP